MAYYADILEYVCDKGYHHLLTKGFIIECQKSGMWSDPYDRCSSEFSSLNQSCFIVLIGRFDQFDTIANQATMELI